jgi:hypothetical protein
MAFLLVSDWENGTGILDSVWTGNTGSLLSVTTANYLTGSHSLELNGTFNPQTTDENVYFNVSNSTIGVRFGYYVNNYSTGGFPLVSLLTTDGYYTGISYSYGGPTNAKFTLEKYQIGSGTSPWSTSGSVPTGYWFQIELLLIPGTSVGWKIWTGTGGTLELTQTFTSSPAIPTGTIVDVYFGSNHTSSSGGSSNPHGPFYFDSFIVSNSGYVGPNVFTGPTLALDPGSTTNTISWSPVSGGTSYNLYWSTALGGPYTKITGATSPYVQTGLTNGQIYYYYATTVISDGEESNVGPTTNVTLPASFYVMPPYWPGY